MYYNDENKLYNDFSQLMWDIAHKLKKHSKMELEDIFQYCCMGLIQANRNYDPQKNKNFKNRVWYIAYYTGLQAIKKYGSFIKVPILRQNDEQNQTLVINDGIGVEFEQKYEDELVTEQNELKQMVIDEIGEEGWSELISTFDQNKIDELKEKLC